MFGGPKVPESGGGNLPEGVKRDLGEILEAINERQRGKGEPELTILDIDWMPNAYRVQAAEDQTAEADLPGGIESIDKSPSLLDDLL